MRYCLDESVKPAKKEIQELLAEKGHEVGETGITICFQKIEQRELTISVSTEKISIRTDRKACFFRGLTKAVQHLEKTRVVQEMEITESINFDVCATMLDCSRNGVLQVRTIKQYIRSMARLGMNCLMLYMEDTYVLKEYPYFGHMRGRYSEEELKECDDYAAGYGIEMIPCIQTLAHLHTPLRFPMFREYRDTEDILLVGEDKVYDLIETMIRSISSCFRTKKIHLGMDEAHGLGLGEYLNRNGYGERFEIMNGHLNRVKNICDKYGLQPAIWSDMYFRLLSPTGDYYDIPYETKAEKMTMPPKGIELVYWDYYHEEEALYQNYFRMHRNLTEQISFAGGGWIWNGIAPNYAKMIATTNAALKVCKEDNISTVICTLWQDNGAETPMMAGVPALALFAEHCFQSQIDWSVLKDFFAYVFEGNWDDYMLLDAFDHVPGVLLNNWNADNPSKYLLYQDPMLGLFDAQIKDWEANTYYEKLQKRLQEVNKQQNSLLFVYYEVLAKVLSQKAQLGIYIKDAYDKKDVRRLRELSDTTVETCIADMKQLLLYRRKIWFEECKPFGYEVLDIRLQGVIGRLESTKIRMEQFITGEIASLEELEEDRIVFCKDEKNMEHSQCSCPLWQNIVSAGNIMGV